MLRGSRVGTAALLCLPPILLLGLTLRSQPSASKGKVHTYYVAADEVDWDYAPDGINKITGKPFEGYAATFMKSGPHSIGRVYRKAIYREYTDGSFTTLKPRAAEWQHLGILGPVLRAEVGDTIRVIFRNHASRSYSMHPHGVFYDKHSEGVVYNDGSSTSDTVVAPGQTHAYVWEVPERAGPGPADGSSVLWLYHSHVNEQRDVNSGLIGPIIIARRGMAGPDGRPKDVDREFVSLFMIFDENVSWYLDHNIQSFTSDPKGVKKLDGKPVDADGLFSVFGTGFISENLRSTINGFMYGNGPMLTMKKAERVRWYLATIGGVVNGHTPHWHGNVVNADGRRTDVVSLLPAQMLTADMIPDNPGIWMYHCHIDDHMMTGMVTLYKVEP
jgi:Multicopper oxidase